jgi:chitodextrinase
MTSDRRPLARALACLAIAVGVLAAVATPGSAASGPWQPRDRQPPTAPTNLRVTEVTHTSVSFAWNPSTDNVGVVSYSLWPEGTGDGVVSVRHPQTTATWTGLRPGQTLTFKVAAFDASFNGSPGSNAVTVTTVPDTTAPTAPSGLSVQSVEGSTVELRWSSAVDQFSPVTHEILVNGVVTPNAASNVPAGTPRPPVQGAWVRQLEPGTTYQFAVRGRDPSGNVSGVSNTVTATTEPSTDTTAPTAPLLTSANVPGTGICPEEIWLRWTGSTDDVDAVVEYEIRVNGVINEVVSNGSTDWVVYTEVFGPNVVTIVAVDRAGNASAPSNAITARTNFGSDCVV